MKPLLKCHPDLQACELEDRILPVISSLGVIVLTTGGYVLVIPSQTLAANTGGPAGGVAIPTSVSTTSLGGIPTIQPGNITGIPSVAPTGATGSTGSLASTPIAVVGANDPTGASNPLVTRDTIANDALNSAPHIGQASGDRSPILPPGQFYHGGVPKNAPLPPASATPGQQSDRLESPIPGDSPPVRPLSAPPPVPAEVSSNLLASDAFLRS